MKKRALMYASVASMIQQFNMANIRLLLESGYEVDVVCNLEQGSTITPEKIAAMRSELEGMGVRVIHVPIPRKISAIGEIITSFRMSRQIIAQGEYSLIHCHSPIGSVLCRLANRFSGRYGKAKMIYTAHGFHFFKGAPLLNWLIFYPMEWFCSWFTDVLITINHEDHDLASRQFRARQVAYVPGIGVDLEKYRTDSSGWAEKLAELGLCGADTILVSVGELSVRKNHEVVLRALAREQDPHYQYLICGLGPLKEQLEQLVEELGIRDRVHFLGYRNDIAQILNIANIYVFPSLQEGLPVALMEAMAAGKAVACSRIRGNTDLIEEQGGTLFDPRSVDDCADAIGRMLNADYEQMGRFNTQKILGFSRETVGRQMADLYRPDPK